MASLSSRLCKTYRNAFTKHTTCKHVKSLGVSFQICWLRVYRIVETEMLKTLELEHMCASLI